MPTTSRLLTARTREIHAGDPLHDRRLLELLPDDTTLSWVCRGEGLVGWGTAARLDTRGPDRLLEADTWWRHLAQRMEIDDGVRLPGTGPVAFTSVAFANQPGHSVLVVPEVVIGQRDGVRWITTIGDDGKENVPANPIAEPGVIRYGDGQFSATNYRRAVAEAVQRLNDPRASSGSENVNKVVLAHDLLATASGPLDSRFLLRNLAERYPNCWTFAVDDLVGATPELLLERLDNRVRSRVLAGTIWPRDGAKPEQLASELSDSSKNLDEHSYAVRSLADSLRPFCSDLAVPDDPEVLRLHNVMHLASNVSGTLRRDDENPSLLHMVNAVHPTAAIGGTPTTPALRLIAELEHMDRGRYTGPVGWVDSEGNGELGIALRCAQIRRGTRADDHPVPNEAGAHGTGAHGTGAQGTGTHNEIGTAGHGRGGDSAEVPIARPARSTPALAGGRPDATGDLPCDQLRLFAGGGIVAESDPDLEVAETEAKLRPMREAIEGVR